MAWLASRGRRVLGDGGVASHCSRGGRPWDVPQDVEGPPPAVGTDGLHAAAFGQIHETRQLGVKLGGVSDELLIGPNEGLPFGLGELLVGLASQEIKS